MTLHQDIHAAINRSRAHQDREVAIEELESAIGRIDTALGFTPPEPDVENGETPDDLLAEARSCIRNDDLVGARIRIRQAIQAGGGDGPEVPTDKALDKMTKAELHAYAKDRGYKVPQANGKPELLARIQELDAETVTTDD